MKHIKHYILFALLFGTIHTETFTNSLDEETSMNFDALIDDPALENLTISPEATRTTPQTVINDLEALGIIPLLEQDLYIKTNPLNVRSLLYYPFVQQPRLSYAYDYIVGGHVFYNEMRKSYFTKNSPHIPSYLGICQPEFLRLADAFAAKIRSLFPNSSVPNPSELFTLFDQATVEQRRIGALFYASYRFNSLELRGILPIYYMQRNFIIGISQRESLETQLGASTDDEQKKFQKSHLISDKYGFGDTRIELDFLVVDRDNAALNVGLYTTIPTALSFGSGGLGSSFEQVCPRPDFSFIPFFDDTVSTNQKIKLKDIFILGALDQLSANLLETPLGNGGHFGLGTYLENDLALSTIIPRSWAEPIFWVNKVYGEYLFPRHEKRFFVRRADPSAFAARDFNNPSQADANLAFLEKEMVNRFYPFVYTTLVYPGFNFEWTSKFAFEGHNGGISIGNDIWMAGKESLATPNVGGQSLNNLDQSAAVRPIAFQSKIFSTIYLKANRETRLWTVSFNGDYTYASQGIGKDFTAAVGLEINF